jgi:thiol-disulfide isomerase/thioredoxin/Flp pilus assembly protein TadD
MRLRALRPLALLTLFAQVTLPQDRGSQRIPIQLGLRESIEAIKKTFFLLDYDEAAAEAALAAQRHPRSAELRAWEVAALARNGQQADALHAAEQLGKQAPNDPWTHFALAFAHVVAEEGEENALKASARALELAPKNPDMIWLRATILRRADQHADALKFIEANLATFADKSLLLTERGEVLNSMSYGATRDTVKAAEARAAFEAARAANPMNPAPLFSLAMASPRAQPAQAVALCEEARKLSPNASSLASYCYDVTMRRTDLSTPEKHKIILDDLEKRLAARADRPTMLTAATATYEMLGMKEKVRGLQDRLLKEFPSSTDAEWVYANRWRALRQDENYANDSAKKKAVVALHREFLRRPNPKHKGLLAEAHLDLFFELQSDSTSDPEELWMTAKGMAEHDRMNYHISRVMGPIALADRKVHLTEAERIATEGLTLLRKKAESQRKYYATEGEFIQSRDWMQGLGRNALGWVYFAQGRTADAKRELLKAYELSANDAGILNHLGKLYESQNQIDSAEMFYIKGANASTPGVNPNKASLTALYKKRKGSLEGIDTYLASLKDIDRANRKKTILASMLAEPKTIKTFSFKTLDGKQISLEGLKGKVAVVNFWGLWCGWCVKEMPDYQKLYEQYKSDTTVAILTLDTNDSNLDEVRSWIQKKSFTFPVMVDDGYVEKNNVTSFPTTWFIDRTGRIRFVKVGWSEQLVEEFSWRIEALRGEGQGTNH